MTPEKTTLDPKEAEQFNRYAQEWWDENGKFKILHQINPLRIRYIKEHILTHCTLKNKTKTPLKGLKILDIGCGGGLLCEPIAQLGAHVTAMDVAEKNIEVAQNHAEKSNLTIDYRVSTIEDYAKKQNFAGENELFDVVIALEVIEHTADPNLFVENCSAVLKPNGLFFGSTINRTLKALALAIIGAEYILGWIPKGTHQWEKFISPKEFSLMLKKNKAKVKNITGMTYNPLKQQFSLNDNTEVNYFITAQKNINP